MSNQESPIISDTLVAILNYCKSPNFNGQFEDAKKALEPIFGSQLRVRHVFEHYVRSYVEAANIKQFQLSVNCEEAILSLAYFMIDYKWTIADPSNVIPSTNEERMKEVISCIGARLRCVRKDWCQEQLSRVPS